MLFRGDLKGLLFVCLMPPVLFKLTLGVSASFPFKVELRSRYPKIRSGIVTKKKPVRLLPIFDD